MPGGWTLTSLAGNQSTPCPAQAVTNDVYEGPDASAACGCGCKLSTPPTCPINVNYDGTQANPSCGSAGSPATMSNASACNTDLYKGGVLFFNYPQLDLQYTPAGATGGQCTASATSSAGAVTYAASDRVCTPGTEPCVGGQCTPSFPSGYEVCVQQVGMHACPGAPFTQQHIVGGAATFTCSGSACSCGVTDGCTGTVTLYATANCTGTTTLEVPVDGKCHNESAASSNTYGSYSFAAAAPGASCTAAGTSAAQGLTLGSPFTVCCSP